MNIRHMLLPAMMLAWVAAVAAPLTPEAALARLPKVGHAAMKAKKVLAAPVYTARCADEAPAVYVFGGDEGFMMVGADDNLPALLAYSDSGRFDAENIPDGLRWWFGVCKAQIESGITAYASENDFAPIDPMVKTKWDQLAPYYDYCPVLDGYSKPCPTGCVATAMAQIMKYHRWPETGTGTQSYTSDYKDGKTGITYSCNINVNFSESTYDWDKMLDDYTKGYTATQSKAVAQLMYDCGAASKMTYGPDGSGANELLAAVGMLKYLGYSSAMHNEQRCWYEADEWEQMVYDELAAGRPILYCGVDSSNAGHAFVCDGYLSDGLFHINWGWSGIDDGYFRLADLNPYNQGTGGGSGQSGFNYGQTVILGIAPASADDGPAPAGMYTPIGFDVEKTVYNKSKDSSLVITGPVYSYSIKTNKYSLQSRFLLPDGSVKVTDVPGFKNQSFAPLYGRNTVTVPLSDIPDGYSILSLYCKTQDTDWQPVKYPLDAQGEILLFTTNTTVNAGLHGAVSDITFPYHSEAGLTADVPATIYASHPNVEVAFDCFRAPWQEEVAIAVADASTLKLIDTGDYHSVMMTVTGDSERVSMAVPTDKIDSNTTYALMGWSRTLGRITPVYYFTFNDDPTAVETTAEDGDEEYFTLDGRRAPASQKGLLIRRSGSRYEKIINR